MKNAPDGALFFLVIGYLVWLNFPINPPCQTLWHSKDFIILSLHHLEFANYYPNLGAEFLASSETC